MKTITETKKELEEIKNEFEIRLKDFIKENPNISVQMAFSTQLTFIDNIMGKKQLINKDVKSEVTIILDI